MSRTAFIFAIALLSAGVPLAPARPQELPASLQVVGVVSSDGEAPVILTGAMVSVIDRDNGSTVGSGSVLDPNGTFLVEMMQSSSFNGRVMRLQILWKGQSYGLYEGSRIAEFPFSGSFPFPSRVNKTVTVHLSPAAARSGSTTPGGVWDVNRDGRFDEKDIEQLYTALGIRSPGTGYDVNGDGVFNSLDIVEARRALQEGRQ